MDMISKLPPTIIENILCLVPIKEAARTSILSKEWRYHWTKIPKVVFDEDTFQVSCYGDELPALCERFNTQSERKRTITRCKLLYAIYSALLKLKGPINEFSLSVQTDTMCVEIDHIIDYLLRSNTVKKVELHMPGGYMLSCHFDNQPTFSGFDSLTTLILESVTITKSTLLHLLSNSPSLTSLTMDTKEVNTIIDLFQCIPMIENFSFWFQALKGFIQDGVPYMLPTPQTHLKNIEIGYMSFVYRYGAHILLCFIRSFPNLEKLKLKLDDDPSMDFMMNPLVH